MQSETEFLALQQTLQPYLPIMGQAADTVINQDVSVYPLFVLFKATADTGIGLPLVESATEEGWNIHLSTLEELVARQVVGMDRVDRFREVYREAGNQLCLLVWADSQARFVFMPR